MSVNSYYEAHITMLGDPDKIEPIVKATGWKFSKIDGDPTLGSGIKCYATKHFKATIDKEDVLCMLHLVANTLKNHNSNVIRRKIELVIYDDRSSTVRFQCNGLCPECKTDTTCYCARCTDYNDT